MAQIVAVQQAGGEVWFGDETTLREFPPLRSAWAKRGEQATVIVSGRNERRVLHGALHLATGDQVQVVRERLRGPDTVALIEALAARPRVGAAGAADRPRLLALDNAPAHKTKVVRAAAEAAGITLAWLPYRAPELNPCEDLWRPLKATVAANRAYPSVDALADRALQWLNDLTGDEVRRITGLTSSKFQWLST